MAGMTEAHYLGCGLADAVTAALESIIHEHDRKAAPNKQRSTFRRRAGNG